MVSEVLNVPIQVASVKSSIGSGVIRFYDFRLKNPKGWESDEDIIKVEYLEVDLNLASLFSDVVIIDKIITNKLRVACDFNLAKGESNLGDLYKLVAKNQDDSRDSAGEETAKKKQKKFLISKIKIKNSIFVIKVNKIKKEIKIKDIDLDNIGSGKQISFSQVIGIILKELLKYSQDILKENKVFKVGQKVADGVVDAVDKAGSILKDSVLDTGRQVLDKTNNIFKAIKKQITE